METDKDNVQVKNNGGVGKCKTLKQLRERTAIELLRSVLLLIPYHQHID